MPKLFAAIAAALMLATVPAFAQQQAPQCGPVQAGFVNLASRYHEAPVWAGQVTQDRALILTMSPDGKTWSLIIAEHGVGCLVGAGTNGEFAVKR